jgi:hypothetical protein
VVGDASSSAARHFRLGGLHAITAAANLSGPKFFGSGTDGRRNRQGRNSPRLMVDNLHVLLLVAQLRHCPAR